MECTVEVRATMMATGHEVGWKAVRMVAVGGGGGGGKDKQKKQDEPVFDVGWGVYEMWVTAADD